MCDIVTHFRWALNFEEVTFDEVLKAHENVYRTLKTKNGYISLLHILMMNHLQVYLQLNRHFLPMWEHTHCTALAGWSTYTQLKSKPASAFIA